MRTIAFVALLAAPCLAKNLAQTKDDTFAERAEKTLAQTTGGYDSYSDKSYSHKSYSEKSESAASYSDNSVEINSHSDNSIEIHSGSNYSVNDRDQYHNNEDNKQSPEVS